MNINDEIIGYVIEKINNDFRGNIDMLLVYGSYINGTANDKSDVDMYFIPRDEKGYELGETFILNGIGYDIFGISWERVEKIAKFQGNLSPLVGDVKVLYSYDDGKIDKFKKLQQQMQEYLNDVSYMHNCSRDRLKEAIIRFNQIFLESSIGKVRLGAGYILMSLAEAVAYRNQTYFHKGLKMQYEDLIKFDKKPEEFTILYHDTITSNSINQIKDNCKKIIRNTINFLELNDELSLSQISKIICIEENKIADPKTEEIIDYNDAANCYEELSSTFNKIYICTENKDYILAFISACCLQDSLESDLEIKLKSKDLLSEFQYDNLEKLALKAHEIEENCINEIERNQATIRRVGSVDELKIQKRIENDAPQRSLL